jgi:hypothetical protein
MALRAISAPVVNNAAYLSVNDLRLFDLEGDGRMEIVVAADKWYDGVIEIYAFNSSNVFTVKWTNTTLPSGSPFSFVSVADLDGNGTPEIVAGNTVAHTGSPGVFVYIFDYPSGTNPWRSVALASGFSPVTGLVVDDLDGNGSKEIAALVATGDLYTFDGPTRQLRDFVPQTGWQLLANRVDPPGLITSDRERTGHFLQYARDSYTESFLRQLGGKTVFGIHVASDGGLWTGTDGALNLRNPPEYLSVVWQSAGVGPGFGRFVAHDFQHGEPRVFSSALHAVAGFTHQSSSPSLIPTPLPASQPLNLSTRNRVLAGR